MKRRGSSPRFWVVGAPGFAVKVADVCRSETMAHAKGLLAKDGYSGGLQAKYRRKGVEALGREIETEVMAAMRDG